MNSFVQGVFYDKSIGIMFLDKIKLSVLMELARCKSFILNCLIALTFSHYSFAVTVDVNATHILLISTAQVDEVKAHIASDIAEKSSGVKPSLRSRIVEKQWNNLSEQVVQKLAEFECQSHLCGTRFCDTAVDFSVELRTDSSADIYTRELSFGTHSELQVSPVKIPFSALDVFIPGSEIQVEGYFFSSLVCTSNHSSSSTAADAQESHSGTQHELEDWQEIASKIPFALRTAIGDGYDSTKKTLAVAPTEATKLALLRFGSMVIPGNGGSQYLGDEAKRLSETIAAKKYGLESDADKFERFMLYYQSHRKVDFSKHDQDRIESIFRQLKARISTPYDHSGEAPALFNKLEAILYRFPQSAKTLRPDVEGLALVQALKESHYAPEIQEKFYNMAAAAAMAAESQEYLPVSPLFLEGPPGTGKTRIVQITAKALGLPLCIIKLENSSEVHQALFGGRSWVHGGTSDRIGKLVECYIEQKDSEGNSLKTNVTNPIIFFDELDKVLNQSDSGSARQLFLELFNNSKEGKFIEVQGLERLTLDLSRATMIIAANDVIRKQMNNDISPSTDSESKAATEGNPFDPFFESRLDIIKMPAYSKEEKDRIASTLLETELRNHALQSLSDEAFRRFREIVDSDHAPGVRELKSKIAGLVAREAAKYKGWDFQKALQMISMP